MKIRCYHESDWRELHALYNRCLGSDQVSPEFFLEHLILSPNFDPSGVMIAEENGRIAGAAVAQIVRRNISPWVDQVALCRETGYLMPPLTDCAEIGGMLLTEAEHWFRAHDRKTIRVAALGPTLFPDSVDQEAYPLISKLLAENHYQAVGRYCSMRCDLDAFRISPEVEKKRCGLSDSGIIAKVCEYEDLPAVRRFLESGDLIGRMTNLAEKSRRHELDEVIVIRNRDDVFGFCQYHYYDEMERVGPFGITSAMRGRGIGQVMVAKLLETMADRGFRTAYFVSCTEENTHFYAKNGFRIFRSKTVFAKTL